MKQQPFQYSFTSSKTIEQVFDHLIDPKHWWTGLFGETIEGNSQALNDEFSFSAAEGMHFSRQRLIELVANRKIVWLATESNLSFLKHTNEWAGTKIKFDLSEENNHTRIIFTHEGLVPTFECYGGCSGAWQQYLQNLEAALNGG
jgi:hypothetical protein